jgi:membrane protease YdiL (CAAX protease family)
VKLYPLLLVAWLIKSGKTKHYEVGLNSQPPLSFFIVFVVTTLIGTILDQNAYKLIAKIHRFPALGAMPLITNPFWNWVDLTFGLLMVAIVEELVFRGYMFAAIREHTSSKPLIVIISSLAFGLIHWSGGLHVVFVTSLIGAVFMIFYIKTHFLPSIMLSHFVVNFIDFSGVIPKSIFQFM